MKRLFSLLLLSLASISANASLPCDDVFIAEYATKMANQAVWAFPDSKEARLQLPLRWDAGAGSLKLSMTAERLTQSLLEIEFSRDDGVASTTYKFLARVDKIDPKPYAATLLDSATGDTWAVKLTPACKSV